MSLITTVSKNIKELYNYQMSSTCSSDHTHGNLDTLVDLPGRSSYMVLRIQVLIHPHMGDGGCQ